MCSIHPHKCQGTGRAVSEWRGQARLTLCRHTASLRAQVYKVTAALIETMDEQVSKSIPGHAHAYPVIAHVYTRPAFTAGGL